MRLLIANRGEIACRIARAARDEGLVSIAVFSDADAGAPHVRAADLAVRLGPGPAAESYLSVERVLAAAERSGATAIHPGYGFLAESADFAQAVLDAGLVWVGPPPQAMRALGDKAQARKVARAVGVPLAAGVEDGDLTAAAEQIGYPVLLKAAAGGGGRGMRVVERAEDLAQAIVSAQREALAGFGDGTLLVERFLPRARHVEVQLLADAHGAVVHLYERECSVQRRRQKVLEEAPAPGLDPALRAQLGAWSVQLARHVGYQGVGTVEFLVHDEGAVFIEMNTRIQVEHTVTEAVCGVDLVRAQLRVARGEPLWLTQDDVQVQGCAIQLRLVAEDPLRDWLPCTGTLARFDLPARPGLRVDTGVRDGSVVSPHYDSLLAKLIVSGPRRELVLDRLAACTREAWVAGLPSNLDLLRSLVDHPDVRAGAVHTRWLEEESGLPRPLPEDPVLAVVLATAIAAALRPSTGAAPAGWRLGGRAEQRERWRVGAEDWAVRDTPIPTGRRVSVGDEDYVTSAVIASPGLAWVAVDGLERPVRFCSVAADGTVHTDLLGELETAYLHWGDGQAVLTLQPRHPAPARAEAEPGACTAPSPGTVRQLHVAVGDAVEAGAALVTLETMKVEQTLRAAAAGTVRAVRAEVGEAVAEGALLVDVELAG